MIFSEFAKFTRDVKDTEQDRAVWTRCFNVKQQIYESREQAFDVLLSASFAKLCDSFGSVRAEAVAGLFAADAD